MADRHGPLRTPVGWFAERVNGGVVSDGAVVVDGDDIGVDELSVPHLDGFGPVPGGRMSVLAPAGIRASDEVSPADLLVLVPGNGSSTDEISVNEGTAYGGPLGSFLPGRSWFPDDPFEPNDRWWPKRYDPGAGSVADGRVLVSIGDRSPVEVFGGAGDTGNNPFDTGNNPFDTGNNPFDTGNNPFLVATPASAVGDGSFGSLRPGEILDAGRPAPLGGATFGLSVLATPNASVAGQSANPLVGESTETMLRREAARRMLKRAGITDAEDVEWLSGPTTVSDVPDGTEFTLLGAEARLESFQGVVSGTDGPWRVVVHVARATPDDHVVAAGVQRSPLGTASASAKKGDTTLVPAREYMASTVDRLAIE
jgi:hypothetical protein